jgi:peptide deformylase
MIITDEKELRKPNAIVTLEESEDIIKQLEVELSQTNGIGLAAPQIGIYKQVAIIRNKEEVINLVNPIIVSRTHPYNHKEESCLSFPEKKFNTARFLEIAIKDDLHPAGFVAVGFSAIVLEHEIGHLFNDLIIDRAINKIGRNDPCPCGLQKEDKRIKFKNCHGKI